MSEVKIRGWINLESESLWEHKPRTIDTVAVVLKSDCDAAQVELAALREELAKVNREKNDVAHRANETAERLNSMTISKATMQNKLKQKLASTQQSLAAAEQRNADRLKLIAGLVEYADNLLSDVNNAWSYAGSTGNPEARKDDDYAAAVALIAKPTESGASE